MNRFSKNSKKKIKIALSLATALFTCQSLADVSPETSWMATDAKFGVSHHYLAGGTLDSAYYQITDYDEWNHYVTNFDVDEYADKAEKLGLGYVIFTITQNRGYVSTTSNVYDQNSPACPVITYGCKNQTGTNKADYTPERDLILDLALALKTKGIKLIAYLPAHVGDRWTGVHQPASFSDWFIEDFIEERAVAWGDNIAGWWFDGWYQAPEASQTLASGNSYPVADKITAAVKTGNPNAIITLSDGFSSSYMPNDPHSNYTQGESNSLPPIPSSGEVTTNIGETVQWHGFTFTSQHHPVFAGWGQVKYNLKYQDEIVADRAKAISDSGGVSTWDVAINPNGKWLVDRLVQMQKVGNKIGNSTDTTYSSLKLVNNTSPGIVYTGSWSLASDIGTGAYQQDTHDTTNNGDYFSYDFSGSSIVFASSKEADQGDIEVFIDDVSQGVFSTYDGYHSQVQDIIFEKHDLTPGDHTLKVVKISGSYMRMDLVLSKSDSSDSSNSIKSNNTDNTISYTGNWGTSSNRGHGDYNDDVAYTVVNGDYATYTFTGTSVSYIAPRASDQGDIEVFIDNISQGVFNTYSANRQVQQVIFTKSELTNESHELKLVKKSGSYMLIDAIEYISESTAIKINNTDPEISFTGTWGHSAGRGHGDYVDDVSYTTSDGDYFSYTFTGTSVTFIAPKASDQGDVEVFIDDVSQGIFDTYSADRQVQQVIFSTSGLTNATHVLKVVKVSGNYMLLDAIEYETAPSNEVQLNNTDGSISYIGSWGTSSNRGHGDYNDDVAYTTANDAYVTFTFTGTTVTYIAPKASDQGDVEIFIDDVSQGIFDTYAANRQVQQNIFTKSGLSNGSHELKLVKKSGAYMLLDSIKYSE